MKTANESSERFSPAQKIVASSHIQMSLNGHFIKK